MDIVEESKTLSAICVLPTYNEKNTIAEIIECIFELQNEINNFTLKVLVVDDMSPDGTGDIVLGLMKKYQNLSLMQGAKMGLGAAYIRGIREAIDKLGADVIIQMDSDGQHDPNVIKNFLLLTSEYDVVIGSRFTEGGKVIDFSMWRLFLSLLGNFLVRYLGGAYLIKDCTSGFRSINVSILKKCDLKNFPTKGYSFQSWLICDLLNNGASITEIPITFEKRISGSSKLSFKDQIEFLINIFKIRFLNSKEFLRYGIVGSVGVLINLGSYYALTRFLDLSPIFSSPIAIEISILNNFLLNNYWTFSTRINETSIVRRLFSFHLVAGISGVLNYSVFLLLLYRMNLPDLYAVIFGITVGIIFNYAGNSLWTFRKVMKRKIKK